jgi:hypothetical protein
LVFKSKVSNFVYPNMSWFGVAREPQYIPRRKFGFKNQPWKVRAIVLLGRSFVHLSSNSFLFCRYNRVSRKLIFKKKLERGKDWYLLTMISKFQFDISTLLAPTQYACLESPSHFPCNFLNLRVKISIWNFEIMVRKSEI